MAANKQIEILFSVLGGGSISGQSGTVISSQINSIVKEIQASNITKLRFDVDVGTLQASLNPLREASNIMRDLAASAQTASASMNSVGNATGTNSLSLQTAQLNKYATVYRQFYRQQSEIAAAGMTGQYQTFLDQAYNGQFESIGAMNNALAQLQANFAQSGYATRNFAQEMNASTQILNKYASMYGSIMGSQGALRKNGLWGQAQTLMSQMKAGIGAPGGFRTIEEANNSIAQFKVACAEAGVNVDSFGTKARNVFARNFGTWISYGLITVGVRAIREVISNITKLDSALTQLEIVTRSSKEELSQFASSAFKSAKELGVAVLDIAKSTETFARLGYSLPDSEKLASLSVAMSKVASIGEEDATTGLTAVMKAWGFTADEMESKADVIVKVGRKYAISSAEILEALENSAGAMAASGESFEHTVALLAAGNAITQNASKTGTAMRTMELRIRSTSAALEELDELGEDTSELAEGFSKYRKEIKALSGVDIMIDDHTYKSVYDILSELAEKWKDLSDTQRATILEDLGGKRGATVLGSIIQNLEDLTGAYADSKDAAGELSEAVDIYGESIEARIQNLKTSLVEMSQNLLSSDALKSLVDSLKKIVEALTAVTGFGNGFVVKSTAFIGTLLLVSKLIVGLTAKITALGTSTFITTVKTAGFSVALMDLNANGVMGFLMTIPKLIVGLASVSKASLMATTQTYGLAAALETLGVNPVFLAIQAVALIGGITYLAIDSANKRAQKSFDNLMKSAEKNIKK